MGPCANHVYLLVDLWPMSADGILLLKYLSRLSSDGQVRVRGSARKMVDNKMLDVVSAQAFGPPRRDASREPVECHRTDPSDV
jgi:hypothetical protein